MWCKDMKNNPFEQRKDKCYSGMLVFLLTLQEKETIGYSTGTGLQK